MADNFKYAQLQPFALAGGGAIIGDTSITLKSMKDIDGNALTMAGDFGTIGFGTIEPGSGTSEEQISFTGLTNNANVTTTLTGVKHVSFVYPYTQSSGLAKTHAGNTTFIISNTSGFYDELTSKDDDETINGKWTFNQPPDSTNDAVNPNNIPRFSQLNKVKVTTNDTIPDFLEPNKIVAGANIILTVLNAGGNEQLQINASGMISPTGSKVAIDTTQVVITGDTLEHDIYSIPIPAGLLGTNNAIKFTLSFVVQVAVAGNQSVIRMKYGSTTIASFNVDNIGAGALNFSCEIAGTITAAGATNSQKGLMRVIQGFNQIVHSAYGASAENSTNPLNLIITAQNSDAGISVAGEFIVVEKIF